MCAFNIKQSEMPKRSASIKKLYPAKRRKTQSSTKKTKKTYKKSSGKYKTKKLGGTAKKVGTSHWLSYGTAQSFPKSKYAYLGGKQSVQSHFNVQRVGRIEGSVGIAGQSFDDVSVAYDTTSIKLLRDYLFSNIRNDLMNTSSAGGLTGASLGNYNAIDDITLLLKNCKKTTTFTNQSNGNAYVDIYDLVARRDMGSATSPSTMWTNGLDQTNDPFNATAAGNGVQLQSFAVGSTPFQSQVFCRYWKVLKVTRLCLGAGETAEHVTKMSPMKKWNMQWNTSDGTTNPTYFRGLTHVTMMVVRGQPTDLASDSTIGITMPEIVYNTTETYATSNFPGTGTLNYQTANAIQGIAGKLLQPGSGVVDTITSA